MQSVFSLFLIVSEKSYKQLKSMMESEYNESAKMFGKQKRLLGKR